MYHMSRITWLWPGLSVTDNQIQSGITYLYVTVNRRGHNLSIVAEDLKYIQFPAL